jgi:site-specific DNA-methyltransferase (adenine-specific)
MDRIIQGDCIEHLRALPDKAVTLILTDPPYGLNMARRGSIGGGRQFTPKNWDVAPPAQEYFDEMRRVSKHQIIWGGNMFSHLLPQSRCWLVWYKKDGLGRNDFADCELAWTSFDRNSLVFNSRWAGFARDSKEKRYAHPTQKALDVMKWCVLEFSNPGETVCDPFCGSGSSLVAAAMLARRYIGMEKEEEYIKIAKERLRECVPTRQRLFIVNAT